MMSNQFTEKFYSPSVGDWLTATELISNNVSQTNLSISSDPSADRLVSIGANPSTFLRPGTGKVDFEYLTDQINFRQQQIPLWKALQITQQERYDSQQTYYQVGQGPHKKYGGGLEPTRENVICSLMNQGILLRELTQITLYSFRTKNSQILKKMLDRVSADDLQLMIQSTLERLSQAIDQADLIFIGWGASLGDQILAQPRFHWYRQSLNEILEPQFDKLTCMKLSKTLQPYHPSSARYKVVPLSTLIDRTELRKMFKLKSSY